ncbi:MAG: S8 family serine peptidase [Planctomycetes bacterium]|nr:S8 family serine peptidase [Planctomycetota bacterium]
MEIGFRALRAWFRAGRKTTHYSSKPPRPRLAVEMLEDRLAPAADWRSVIGLDAASNVFPYSGQGYSVAILDTGIDYNHPDLGGGFGAGYRVVAGYDFVNNDADPMDDNGHGTHLAGIIGSGNGNSPGVAPNVQFIALKVLDSKMNGSWAAVDNALQWVIANQAQYNIVGVNLSLGSGNYTSNPYSLLESDFSTLKSLGVFTAAAAGNFFYTYNSQPGVGYPSISPNVVSVGATWAGDFGPATFSTGAKDYTTAVDRIASLGQRGPALDLMAPGAWITSTWLGGGYKSMGGTSMATAVVTGSAVLLHQAYDQTGKAALATQDNLLKVMKSSGVTVKDGDDENDNVVNTGLTFKRLDLNKALGAIGQPNAKPVLAPIASWTLQVGQTILVPLAATDADGEPITFTYKQIYLTAQAYQLDQQFGFRYLGGYYQNSAGANEKWILGNGSIWYCIMPTGEVRRWTGSLADMLRPANLIATLDPSYHADPSKLWNAPYAGMPPAVFSLIGNQLSIRSPAYWLGTYQVEVTASDGHYAVKGVFNVTVTNANTPPVLMAIANQTMSHAKGSTTLNLSATDADKDAITYAAQVLPVDGKSPAVTLGLNGNQLTISPDRALVGTFTVQISASDGKASDTKTFVVTVTNSAPSLGAIPGQTLAKGQTRVTLTLPASDADGDALSIQAVAQTPDAQAYQLKQQYGFQPYGGSYYTNLWGYNEKWLVGNNNLWYVLLPNGEIYRWTQSIQQTLTAANRVAALDAKYYVEPLLLWDAKPATTPALTFTYSGNQLTIQRPATLTGVFYIDVTVSDGAARVTRTVQIVLN